MERREFLKKSALAALGTAVAGTGLVQAFNHINDNESKTDKMKIVVLTGSPRKNGNSAYLAEQFIKSAEEKGHEVFRFDCAFKQVEPCLQPLRHERAMYFQRRLSGTPSAFDRSGHGGIRYADVLLQHLGTDETGDRPLLCHQRTDKGSIPKSRLPDDLRRYLPKRGGTDAGALPYADGLSRLDKRWRSGGFGRMDGRQRQEYGLSAASLPVGQEFIILYQKKNEEYNSNNRPRAGWKPVHDGTNNRHYEQN